MDLTVEQRAVVDSEAKLRVVIAHPGTGKTTVLVEILYDLIEKRQRDPECIVAVAFSRNAARKLRERLEARLGHPAPILIDTSTGLAVRIIRDVLTSPLTIFDEEDRRDILDQIIAGGGYKVTRSGVLRALRESRRAWPGCWRRDELRAAAQYEHLLDLKGAIDLDHVLLSAARILQSSGPSSATEQVFRNRWRWRCRYLVVDEYQDVSDDEAKLFDLLMPVERAVVGDVNQAIYGFRGARHGHLLGLARAAGTDSTFYLTRGFRCGEMIVGAANALVGKNRDQPPEDQRLKPTADRTAIVNRLQPPTFEAEETLVDQLTSVHGAAAETVAVLGRTNSEVSWVLRALRRLGRKAYQLTSGSEFYALREVRTFHAYLRARVNPRDPIAEILVAETWPWAPKRGTPPWFEAERESIRSDKPLLETLGFLVFDWQEGLLESAGQAASILAARYRGEDEADAAVNVEEACRRVHAWITAGNPPEIQAYLDWLQSREIDPVVSADREPDEIAVGTIHSAKGLEWDAVVIVGLEDGNFPIPRADVEEERRLLYVGITRARRAVHLVSCSQDRLQPSRFMAECGT